MWYKTGTITTENGSAEIVGVQTLWASQVKPGDMLSVDGVSMYEVSNVVDDTHITLARPYLGASASAQSYSIVPLSSEWGMNTQLAADLAGLIQDYQSRIDDDYKGIKGDTGPSPFNYRGLWQSGVTYSSTANEQMDMVSGPDNRLYVCVLSVTGDTAPADDTIHWNLLNAEVLETPPAYQTLSQDVNVFSTGTDKDGTDISSSLITASPSTVAVQGQTITNLLGEYGGFKVDSNADGLADGWSLLSNRYGSCSLTSEGQVFNDGGQGAETNSIRFPFTSVTGNKYLVIFEYKKPESALFATIGFGRGDRDSIVISKNAGFALSDYVEFQADVKIITGDATQTHFLCATYQSGQDGIVNSVTLAKQGLILVDLSTTFGAGNEPSEAWCKANIGYFENTVSVRDPEIVSINDDSTKTDALHLPVTLRSLPNGVKDEVLNDGTWIHRISSGVAVASGVAVNTTNYPDAKDGGQFRNVFDASGEEFGIIGTDSTTGAGTLYYELSTPVTTSLETGVPYINTWSGGQVSIQGLFSDELTYTTSLTFPDALSEVTSCYKIVSGERVDAATTLAADGLTATIAGATAGEVYHVEGRYGNGGDMPVPTEITYPVDRSGVVENVVHQTGQNATQVEDLREQLAIAQLRIDGIEV